MYTLANNTIMPSMKENISLVVKIRTFQDFYFMPCILINMHDIDTKNNTDHLRAMGHLGTTYVIYPTYRSSDLMFTSFFRQNHIKLQPTMHINDIQHFKIAKTCILVNNMIMLNMKQNIHVVVKLWRFQEFYIKPRLLINMHDITNKNNSAHLRAMGYQCTPIWHVSYVLTLRFRVYKLGVTHTHRQTHTGMFYLHSGATIVLPFVLNP